MNKSYREKKWLTRLTISAVGASILMLLCFGFLIKDWISLQRDSQIGVKEKFEATSSGVGTAAAVLGGIVLFFNFKVADQNRKISDDKQITERFGKAIEQLSSDKIEVRLGGIYSLERISKDSEYDHWTVIEILSSYIREKSHNQVINAYQPRLSYPTSFFLSTVDEQQQRPLPADIQTILIIMARCHTFNANSPRINLHNTNLQGAKLGDEEDLAGVKAEFSRVILTKANLTNAVLKGAILIKANLTDAVLNGADLASAVLCQIEAERIKLRKAFFVDADLTGANLMSADLTDADCTRADLTQAKFNKATLGATSFYHAILLETDFKEAKGLTVYQLEKAYLCGVKLPNNIRDLDPMRDCNCEAIRKRRSVMKPKVRE